MITEITDFVYYHNNHLEYDLPRQAEHHLRLQLATELQPIGIPKRLRYLTALFSVLLVEWRTNMTQEY
jgi:hypothetical protein